MREVSERLREPKKVASLAKNQPNPWIDEEGPARVEFLRTAWINTKKYPDISAIATEISSKFRRNVSKSAITSKGHQLGLGARGTSVALAKSAAPAAQIARAEKSPPPYYGTALRLDPMPDDGLLFEDLKTGMCKWPLGSIRDEVRFFCGAKADGNYCARHYAISRAAKRAA